MSHRRSIPIVPLLVLAIGALGCAEREAPSESTPVAPAIRVEGSPLLTLERQERVARRLALALREPGARRALVATLQRGQGHERKLHFQALLQRDQGRWHRAMAPGGGTDEALMRADLAALPALELYLPVPTHRAQWTGSAEILVATAVEDYVAPVAYDSRGRRRLLDAAQPPQEPVLALVPAEQAFLPAATVPCEEGCGTAITSTTLPAGLYMTAAAFTQTFEGWLRGDPEFEVHVLGQDGQGSSLRAYQCAGERAGGPYFYDQNAKTWSGRALLFSQAQLDAYEAIHPGQTLRILVVEDDDTACQLRTEANLLTSLFKAMDAAYKLMTAGSEQRTLEWAYRNAPAFQQAITSVASLLKTNDEVVGTAIEDVVVRQTWPGANWIVKGAGNVTNGGIRLELR